MKHLIIELAEKRVAIRTATVSYKGRVTYHREYITVNTDDLCTPRVHIPILALQAIEEWKDPFQEEDQ